MIYNEVLVNFQRLAILNGTLENTCTNPVIKLIWKTVYTGNEYDQKTKTY